MAKKTIARKTPKKAAVNKKPIKKTPARKAAAKKATPKAAVKKKAAAARKPAAKQSSALKVTATKKIVTKAPKKTVKKASFRALEAKFTGPADSAQGVIVIDPGHGGTTTVGHSSPNNATALPSGTLEKTMTLDMALRVRAALNESAPNVRVVLTRNSDVNVGIVDRARTAANNDADLFLCIHFNDYNGSARGTETWIRAGSHGNINLAQDQAFADRIQQAVYSSIRALDAGTHDRGVKPDDQRPDALGVLNEASLGTAQNGCRSCLVEMEFIDVPAVDSLFNTSPNADANKDSIAQAITEALIASL